MGGVILPTDTPRGARRSGAPWPDRTAAAPPLWLIVVAVVLLALGLALQNRAAGGTAEVAAAPAVRGVVINELMSANRSAVRDDRGRYADWVELTNASDAPVDVGGWSLTDGEERLVGFTFPEQVMAPGECVLIYATGNLKNVKGYPYHAPFKLNARGERVVLRDRSGALVDAVDCPSLEGNQAYARRTQNGTWVTTLYYTPGMPNTPENHRRWAAQVGSASGALVINELMPDNETYRLGARGESCDYIELRNQGDQPIDLAGYMLSDDEGRPDKHVLPGRTLEPGAVLLVLASGEASQTPDEPHAPFKLSAKGETVVLSDPSGRLIDRVSCPALDADRAWSRMDDGRFTADFPPTPGEPNTPEGLKRIERALSAGNPDKLTLNEAIASARKPNTAKSTGDWAELYNASGEAIDLKGYGLSDDPGHPRKWRFPSGAHIAPGQYLLVQLTGEDRANPAKALYAANFKLSCARGETLTLSRPDGTVIDRLPMLNQRAAVSYGRMSGRDGYYYLTEPTPGAANAGPAYAGRADAVAFSRPGGWFEGGEFLVELSAGPGQQVRYTLDASEPTEQSSLYSGAIAVSKTTIIRARAYGEDLLPSMTHTQSYLFGPRHSLPVVSLVSDPEYLFGSRGGIYAMGPNELKYPFKGANFWKSWERAANIELFAPDGTTVLSQGTALALQGQYSRMESQKAFKLTARAVYGPPSFDAALFPNRAYDSYRSFLLRSSGQDTNKTRLRDAVLASLAENTGVFYQDAAPAVVYLNGEYWGHYNLRERIHKYSIAQREGWKDLDAIDIVKGNGTVKQGTDADYQAFLTWLKKNGCVSEANLAKVYEMVDVDNYLDYVALEMYTGNTDLLNVKRYRSREGDGRWKWVLYDTDWAFYTDTDSYRRWLDKGGAGSGKKTDNTLFVQLMRNPAIKEKFLRRFGELMYTSWRPDIVNAKIDAYARLIEPEMAAQTARWGGSVKRWRSALNSFKKYADERPRKMLGYIKRELKWSDAQMRAYFGDIMDHLGR